MADQPVQTHFTDQEVLNKINLALNDPNSTLNDIEIAILEYVRYLIQQNIYSTFRMTFYELVLKPLEGDDPEESVAYANYSYNYVVTAIKRVTSDILKVPRKYSRILADCVSKCSGRFKVVEILEPATPAIPATEDSPEIPAKEERVETVVSGTGLQDAIVGNIWLDLSFIARDDTHVFSQELMRKYRIMCDAQFILVVEQAGVYDRLRELGIHQLCRCVIVTSNGQSDLASRAMVYSLHKLWGIPVYGYADADCYGIHIINKFFDGGPSLGVDGGKRFSVPIRWIGVRVSQILGMMKNPRYKNERLKRYFVKQLPQTDQTQLLNLSERQSTFCRDANGRDRNWKAKKREINLMFTHGNVQMNVLNCPGLPAGFILDFALTLISKDLAGKGEMVFGEPAAL